MKTWGGWVLWLGLASVASAEIQYDMRLVDVAGNPPATPLTLGSVDYDYYVATRPVSTGEFVEFLNTKQIDYQWWLDMDRPQYDFASFFEDENGAYRSKPGFEDRAVKGVDWYSSVRFINWMHNGQGDGDTETGAYTLIDNPQVHYYRFGSTQVIILDGDKTIDRNADARYFLPNHDEYIKAMHFDQDNPPAFDQFSQLGVHDGETISDDPAHRPHNYAEHGETNRVSKPNKGENTWDGVYKQTIATRYFQPEYGSGGCAVQSICPQYKSFRLYSPGQRYDVYGDLDLDSDVDSNDLLELLGTWTGADPLEGHWRSRGEGDSDRDGDVDSADLLSFIGGWTGSAEAGLASVPEPATGAALLLGIVWILTIRRRVL